MRHALVILTTALALCVSWSCSSSNAPASSGDKPVIKIAHNDWLSAELNDTVAQILLQEQMHYTVNLVDAGTTDQWPSVKAGDLHVSLEVWPSGHPDAIQQYIVQEKSVEDAGTLGPVARVGWFLPTYMLTAHPELATWEGLKDPAVVALFATPDTNGKGRFVGGDPSWVQWDQKLIDNLGLDFTVTFAGSEDAEMTLLDQAYDARAPMLFYFWEPHWVFAKHDLTLMELPPYDPALWAQQKCSYPSDPLFKIVWPGLATYAPAVYRFFKAFSYTEQDQVQMMKAVHDGATVDQAARDWINTHESVWRTWIPAAS